MRRLRVAIVGCGWTADTQMRTGFAMLPDAYQVTRCCDLDADKAVSFAARHAIPVASGCVDETIAADDVDVVSICTPPVAHFEQVRAVLKAGRHVICEKPFVASLAQADEIIALEAGSPKRVAPVFQYRFGDGIAKVRALIRSGLPGRAYVSSIETAWRRGADYYATPWRGKFATELGGVLLTQSIHIHDLLFDLMGPAAEVKAFKTTRVNPVEVEDCAVAALTMADGSLASLTATLGSVRPATRIRLCFENLTVERQCFDELAPRPGAEPWQVTTATPEIEAEANAIMAGVARAPVGFAGQFADVHARLADGEPFAVTLEDARRSLELVTAIFHSASTGEPATLPIGAAHPLYSGWVPGNG